MVRDGGAGLLLQLRHCLKRPNLHPMPFRVRRQIRTVQHNLSIWRESRMRMRVLVVEHARMGSGTKPRATPKRVSLWDKRRRRCHSPWVWSTQQATSSPARGRSRALRTSGAPDRRACPTTGIGATGEALVAEQQSVVGAPFGHGTSCCWHLVRWTTLLYVWNQVENSL